MKLGRRAKPPVSTGRQRILEGSDLTAPQNFAYHARRSSDALNTGRLTDRASLRPAAKRFGRFWLNRFGLAVLLVAVIAAAINCLLLSPNAKIVELSGGNHAWLQSASTYQAAANKLLSSSIWNRSKLTISTAGLSQRLSQEFPELSGVSVTLPLINHRPTFYLQVAQPALVLKTNSGSFIVDTTGKTLMAASPGSAAQLGVPTVNDQSGGVVHLHRLALSGTDVEFIRTVVAELAAKNVTISSFDLPAASSELDAHLVGSPYIVKFNLQTGDARQQAGTFLATKATLMGEHITPSQYIDVRLDGRAYYK